MKINWLFEPIYVKSNKMLNRIFITLTINQSKCYTRQCDDCYFLIHTSVHVSFCIISNG